MKTYFILLLNILFLSYIAFEINPLEINNIAGTTASTKLITKDSLKFEGIVYNFEVFKNISTNLLLVKDDRGHVKLDGLQYFGQVNGGFQALNENTEIVYYNYELQKLTSAPKLEIYGYCGNVATFLLIIEKENNKYLIKRGSSFTNEASYEDLVSIDTIPAQDIIDICFIGGERVLSYDENVRSPEIIIIQYKDGHGIYNNKNIEGYEQVFDDAWPIKVMCNNQYGYYNITNGAPYISLGQYDLNLAAIETATGATGYIDYMGNEYLRK